jgi:uncharacterized protein YggL (DUF469 family)|tara:strand:+ start:1236 stop:1571 length:336 start_codon:yes stop_codon:yes gene_type:complete
MSTVTAHNRRQRKKLHLAEFAVQGFDLSCQIALKTEAELDAFFKSLAAFIHSQQLLIWADGDAGQLSAYVTSDQRYGSVSDDNRTDIEAWLHTKPELSEISIGALVDTYYG